MRSTQLQAQYDSLYTAETDVFGAGVPLKIVTRLKDYLPQGSVLDIGGGEGRHALYLAAQGYKVSVYDISPVGIKKLQQRAAEKQLSITTKVTDVSTETIVGMYEAVVNTFVLHHLQSETAREVLLDAMHHTTTGGVHILSTFAKQGDLYERNKKSHRFYPDEVELKILYQDWDIQEMSTTEVTTHARDKTGQRMRNLVVQMLAVKS